MIQMILDESKSDDAIETERINNNRKLIADYFFKRNGNWPSYHRLNSDGSKMIIEEQYAVIQDYVTPNVGTMHPQNKEYSFVKDTDVKQYYGSIIEYRRCYKINTGTTNK